MKSLKSLKSFKSLPSRQYSKTPSKYQQLKSMLQSNEMEFIMEAHSGLSAKIVEQTGFNGVWASGLSISAQLGVRDCNEASWTQVVDVVEFMNDAVDIPILMDCDTGFGNFNNARRLAKKLEQKQIAGMCIEDKIFPKTNSFISANQVLAPIPEFTGKIHAIRDATDEVIVVARCEALIAGLGQEEALKRCEAYHQAGVDAILIHSKQKDGVEIREFMEAWGDRCPVIIVPTTYYGVPTQDFRDWGVSLTIWANHNLRASVRAMKEVSEEVYAQQSLGTVEGNIDTVKQIFELQNEQELRDAEKKYNTW